MTPPFSVVVPTVGRPSLHRLLRTVSDAKGPDPHEVVVVDDRRHPQEPLGPWPARLDGRVRVVRGGAAGPAAARNRGWRATATPWVAFLDDDVVPAGDWLADLAEDLERAGPTVAGVQGRIRVPLPDHRPATDWERNVAGLESARWATADMAYRRLALADVGGFDERFPRAFREDADLALRVLDAGWDLQVGRRSTEHPVRPADRWISVRLQAGNADDPLMTAIHGRDWRRRAGAAGGRRPRHLATAAAAFAAATGVAAGRRRLATAGLAGWLAGTADLAAARIRPGPRTLDEIATMVATSAAIPIAATGHWVRGLTRRRRLLGDTDRAPRPRPAAVLFDRDGTLVDDVPYNGDPDRVRPVPGARDAIARLRSEGIAVAVITNQSGVARGLLTEEQVRAVNDRVDALLGPFDAWAVCVHGPRDGCGCRKPAPGLVTEVARRLAVDPRHCAVIGDIGSDVLAAAAAGARGVLVPTPVTRAEEVAAAKEVAPDLPTAVERLLGAAR